MSQQLLWNESSVYGSPEPASIGTAKCHCQKMLDVWLSTTLLCCLPCKTGFVSRDGEHIHWDLAYVYDWYRRETGMTMKAHAFYANAKEQLEKRFGAINLVQVLSLRGAAARPGIQKIHYFRPVSQRTILWFQSIVLF